MVLFNQSSTSPGYGRTFIGTLIRWSQILAAQEAGMEREARGRPAPRVPACVLASTPRVRATRPKPLPTSPFPRDRRSEQLSPQLPASRQMRRAVANGCALLIMSCCTPNTYSGLQCHTLYSQPCAYQANNQPQPSCSCQSRVPRRQAEKVGHVSSLIPLPGRDFAGDGPVLVI